MAIAELDLRDVTAGGIDLLGHDGCARRVAAGFAAQDVAAAVDANGRRLRRCVRPNPARLPRTTPRDSLLERVYLDYLALFLNYLT
jgi:NADPH-dependent 2,4-dienoyl-CoA reductase/sulfur reductase-like enzyme